MSTPIITLWKSPWGSAAVILAGLSVLAPRFALADGTSAAVLVSNKSTGKPSVSTVSADGPDITVHAYVLAATDQLEILVQGHEDLHQTVTVLSDGTFEYPLAGKVYAAGKTVDQLQAELTRAVSVTCKDPVVTVVVRESHTKKITVAGTVKSPGLYDYHPGLRILELLASCGGSTQEPQLTQATVVTDSGTKSVPVDLVALMNGGDPTQNVALSPGDMVLFSPRDPETSMVQVIGQVGKPGQYSVITGGMTILSLLTEAGSATPQAALTQTQLMHAGQVQTLDLHPLKYNLSDPVGKIKLVAGDTLLIPENKQKIAVYGEVHSPSVYLIPDGEDLPLTQALAQAGGPTDSGDKKQVGILRLGPDHKRHLLTVNMDALLKGDAQIADTDLQPGDILVVPTRRKGHSVGEYIAQASILSTLTTLGL